MMMAKKIICYVSDVNLGILGEDANGKRILELALIGKGVGGVSKSEYKLSEKQFEWVTKDVENCKLMFAISDGKPSFHDDKVSSYKECWMRSTLPKDSAVMKQCFIDEIKKFVKEQDCDWTLITE